ncbi:hypothetical protein ACSEE7_20565 [Halomonas cupida]|uniref:hypothetical protein n=1 Tax=Halomonas cupida TaxID=44933 RepID=UPI003EF74753
MNKQTDWEIVLDGDSLLLHNMNDSLSRTDYFRLYGGINHWLDCQDDNFFFDSLYFDGEDDSYAVWQTAYELIDLLNGAITLYRKEFYKIRPKSVNLKNREVKYCTNDKLQGLLGRPNISAEEHHIQLESSLREFKPLGWLVLATERKDVYMILKLLNLENGWVTYYKILETIESCCRENEFSIDIDTKTRKKFTNTANNFSISSFDSRHGFKEIVKENKTPAMNLDEAYEFIVELCKSYINMAYNNHILGLAHEKESQSEEDGQQG